MKFTMLGCGTSSGVPRIGGDWGACDPAEPRNRRTRVSGLVEAGGTRILIDTGPDMRAQLLAAGVSRLDAVIWTHDHADHVHGIDDLRQVYHALGRPVVTYANEGTMAVLRARFGYVFDGRDGYPSTCEGRLLGQDQRIGAIRVRSVAQPHGSILSAGLRFDHDGNSIGYATDFHTMTDEMAALYAGVDLWIVDALRDRPHPTHPTLAQAIDFARGLGVGRALLTHMDQSMDYRTLCATLPAGIEPGHDGLEVTL